MQNNFFLAAELATLKQSSLQKKFFCIVLHCLKVKFIG